MSPRVFTRVVDAIMAHVRSLGLQVHHYLDDWLLRNQRLGHLRTQTQGLLHLTTRLGWIPRLEKSEVSPAQDFVFIDTHYRTDLGRTGSLQRSGSEKQPSMLVGFSRHSMLQLGTFSHCWGGWCQCQIWYP